MRENPIEHYLVEVLGIKSFVASSDFEVMKARPELGVSEAEAVVRGPAEAPVAVLHSHDLAEPQIGLINKMLGAIKVSEPYFVRLAPKADLGQSLSAFKGRALVTFEPEIFKTLEGSVDPEFETLLLPELQDLLEGPEAEVKALKMKAWNGLKELQQRIH